MDKVLRSTRFIKSMEIWDQDIADAARKEGCVHCGGALHSAKYRRKPKGVPEWEAEETRRFSFCCAEDGCRRRRTPPSVRFLGRRVYAGVVVVLVSAMMHGLSRSRVKRLRLELKGIDERTLRRWRKWWLETFVEGPFWKTARARFMPRLVEKTMPLCLVEAFGGLCEDGLLRLLEFLSPITVPARKEAPAM